ncbi:MAG TPA: 3-deoxy-D-manno-octulosonic acid transferase, partial [Desulfatiglandales bacterium]|nr:3-deoxy-D-manno-octulosonic acid transferase [Desulfatiglandales bacterium]
MKNKGKPEAGNMFILYHFLTTILIIVFFPILLKNKVRFKERLGIGIPSLDKSRSNRLWVHALSVGEVISAVPLIEALKNRYPSIQLVLTVKTATGLKLAKEMLKGKVDFLLPMPVDFWWSARRMIKKINPIIFILVETDIWPALILSLRKKGVKTILVNGRISPKTEKSYGKWRLLIKRVLNLLELYLMQTDIDKYRIMSGGISQNKIRVTGNIKFDKAWTPMGHKERNRWLELFNIKTGSIWVAGSTHDPEERIIFKVFYQLKKRFTDLYLIIAPRESSRFDDVYDIALDFGFEAVRRTGFPAKKQEHNVCILDSLGELGRIYGLADVAFVGGSLVRKGGHNLLEPASFGTPVLFGPHTFNFLTMSQSLAKCGGGKVVAGESELLHAMTELLSQ